MQKEDEEKNEKKNIINMLSEYTPLEIWVELNVCRFYFPLVLHCNLSKMSVQQFFLASIEFCVFVFVLFHQINFHYSSNGFSF